MLFCNSVPYRNAYRNDVLNLVCVAMTFEVFHSITFIKLCCMTDCTSGQHRSAVLCALSRSVCLQLQLHIRGDGMT